MYKLTAIVPHGEGTGFELAGVRVREVSHHDDIAGVLDAEMNDDNNGIILMDEALLEALPPRIRKRADNSTIPLIVGVPIIRQWEYLHDRSEVIEGIIRRAVGYRIKITGD